MENTPQYNGSPRYVPQSDLGSSAQYMLDEIEYARNGIYFYTERFETQTTYYLAGLAAIASVVAVILTAAQSLEQQVALLVLCFAAWIYSAVLFARLCASRASLVMKLAHERRAQEYFLRQDPSLRTYSALKTIASALDLDDYAFRPLTMFLFGILASFAALVGLVAWTGGALFVFQTFGSSGLVGSQALWSVLIGMVAFLSTVGWCLYCMKSRRRQARRYVDGYLGRLVASLQESETSDKGKESSVAA